MFTKNKISQSIIDAVNQVIGEDNELNEATEKVPTPTGVKVYGSSYGNSMKARKDQTSHEIDKIKEPKAKDLTKEELKGDQHKIDANKNNKIDAHDFKLLRAKTQKEEMSFADKLKASIKENKATGAEEIFTDNNIGEMSDAQMKKREKIVMSMKNKQADFKDRYGKRWKDVMYATATKQAMKEDSSDSYEENLDEADVTTDMIGGRVDGGKSNDFKSYKVKLKALDKSDEDDVKVPLTKMASSTPASLSLKKEEKEEKEDEKEESCEDEVKKHEKRLHGKDGEVSKHVSKMHKEESEEIDESTPPKNTDIADKSYLKDMGKKPTVKSDIKNFGRFLAGKKETNEAKEPETDNVPFEGPYTKTPETIKDKSGAVHTPMSRAKDLARQAFKKLKKETMMGKISN